MSTDTTCLHPRHKKGQRKCLPWPDREAATHASALYPQLHLQLSKLAIDQEYYELNFLELMRVRHPCGVEDSCADT